MPDLAKHNAQLVRDYLEAVNGWDFEAMRVLLHPDITVTKGLRRHDRLHPPRHQVHRTGEPPRHHRGAVCLGSQRAAGRIQERDAHQGHRREYRNNYVVRATVQDGKIVRFAEYFDPIKLVIAMGGTVSIPS